MIIWKSKPKTEETIPSFLKGKRSWRWIAAIERHWIGIEEQVLMPKTIPDDPNEKQREWEGGRLRYFCLSFMKNWQFFKESHNYYDGPHCSYQIGPLLISWSWNWCSKCMPEQN